MQNNQITELEKLVAVDTSEQSQLESIHRQIAELETQISAGDDGKTDAATIASQQVVKQSQISQLSRQVDIYRTRSSTRLQLLHAHYRQGVDEHKKAERQFTDDNWQKADALWQEYAEQFEKLRDVLLSIARLKDSSETRFSEMLKSLLESNDLFEWSDTKVGAEKLGHYQASPEQPQALRDAVEILDRELGAGWEHQNAEVMERMLSPELEQLGPVVHHSVVETHYVEQPESQSRQRFVREHGERAGSGGGA